MLDTDTYEKQAERMSEELMREGLLNGTGEKETYEISPIYDRHADLFTRQAVEARLAQRADDRTRNLAYYAVDGFIGMDVKDLSEAIVNGEMAAVVDFGDDQAPYRSAPVAIQNETNRERRLRCESAYLGVMDSLNPKRREAWDKVYGLSADLGFKSYRAMCDELGRLRLEWLLESTTRILEATSAGWQERVNQALAKTGATPEDGCTADIAHFFRAREFDEAFPAERLLPALKETWLALGFDMDSQPNLRMDVGDRPLKSPRAFCAPVRIPEEVWLVIKPHGGQDDYNSILHESGHAEHFVHADVSLPYGLRGLGDTSVTEAYAFLFNNLLFNRRWLEKTLGKRDWTPFLEFNRFSETWMLRRYCAKLHYEWELHSGGSVDGAALYTQTLGRHLGVRIAPERYLADVDDAFYVAQYLRAWHLEAQIREKLQREFGEEWFASREAGGMLKELFSLGESLDAWQIAAHLGLGGLDAGPLVRSLMNPRTGA